MSEPSTPPARDSHFHHSQRSLNSSVFRFSVFRQQSEEYKLVYSNFFIPEFAKINALKNDKHNIFGALVYGFKSVHFLPFVTMSFAPTFQPLALRAISRFFLNLFSSTIRQTIWPNPGPGVFFVPIRQIYFFLIIGY